MIADMNNESNISVPNFRSRALRRSKDDKEYALYKAALEWSLVDPIVIESREDLKSEYQWIDRVKPYNHQVTNLITFCRRLPVTLLADDVGLGKTISAGLIMSELISRGRLSKILIVCPKILREQWKEELDVKFNIPSVIVTGKELITAKTPGEAGAIITTYQSARLYLDQIEQSGFDMLILDEAHKLRNLYGVDPAPQVAIRFRKALEDRLFKYVLMLTATPIQNRLWDLYSLIDLLTVARGHENPFGSQGIFSRKFIADNKNDARKLNPENKDEFRSIVYGYMSRVRRNDANLHFPERVVQLHQVDPTPKELELIKIIAEPIQKLNFFAQIIILQALVSSPEALVKVLNGMAERKTAPKELAEEVQKVAKLIPITAKLKGLEALIEGLKAEQPDTWRVVIFTRWRETQTTIQCFLEEKGISCGLINGDSGSRNQETIAKFKKDIPEVHVIVSTEAGSEGVNLQSANVLVNYDLPWNPMIVEQRIGRIQRLSSNYANVSIFNIVLRNTFEEYIVNRLMQKLQMASQAIGDVEALLEASGIDEGEDNSVGGFEEKIRQLVIASLAGKDVKEATRKAEASISQAQEELKKEEKNINDLLGRMDEADIGPECPQLPNTIHSMDAQSFSLAALASLGAKLSSQTSNLYLSELEGRRELIRFDNNEKETTLTSILYSPGTSAFDRLVNKIASKRWHRVENTDQNLSKKAEELARNWVYGFDGKFKSFKIDKAKRCFTGTVLVQIRATVAHDSYERLVEIKCSPNEYSTEVDISNLNYNFDIIENPEEVGINKELLTKSASLDSGILEFCRFYNERKTEEVKSAGNDIRLKKKMEDDFTPRLQLDLVGIQGTIYTQIQGTTTYNIDSENSYNSAITLIPSTNEIKKLPEMARCTKTDRLLPSDCIGKCEISGLRVSKDLLIKSKISGRMALAEHIVTCSLTGKRILEDEAEKSAISGELVSVSLLKTSPISGKHAEPKFFGRCEFTSSEVLESELTVSQVSGKKYRTDEQLQSVVSGKTGHKQEFIYCSETHAPILESEAEVCEVTKKVVLPGVLEVCEVTKKHVLPSKLEKSVVSGKKALKKFFVSSSVSNARLLESEAIKSIKGNFCSPLESKTCTWSNKNFHPEDLKICSLTELPIYIGYLSGKPLKFEALNNLLQGLKRTTEVEEEWDIISAKASEILQSKNCVVESSTLSPDKKKVAVCIEVKTWMGLKVRYAGLLFSIDDKSIIGKIALGKFDEKWVLEETC